MTRLIDPHLDELSSLMAQMGDLAAKSINLALDSYLIGKNARDEVYELSRQISRLYDQIGNLTFEMILKYQPVARDFRLIRSSIEISYAFTRFGRYAYDIISVRDMFGDLS